MKAIKESVTVVMSVDERDELRNDLSRIHGFLEAHFAGRDVENDGSDDCKLFDSMSRIENVMHVLDAAIYA